MEKRCEFCMTLSPIVYCKADAAHLCLSCDAKVHSANALSYRHPRTLVCESCRYNPAIVRCLDHEMFMCMTCDATHHHVSFQHHKKLVSCYVGCPSAKDLAALWGLDLNGLDNECIESEGGSSSRDTKAVKDDNPQQQSNYLILQQILYLERLQISGDIKGSCLLNVKERTDGSPFRHDTMWKVHKNLNNPMEHFEGHLEFQHTVSPLEEKTDEPLSSSPFSQLDPLTSTGNPLHGDSFWQYKSPAHNNEIWLQNMQDLGVCDEVQCFDDVNIPDVDLTFRNFEELFGSEHEPNRALIDDNDMACSFADAKHHPSFGKLDRGCASTIERPNDVDKESNTSDQAHQLQTTNHHHYYPIRPSYSALSFSVSRITGESSGSEYKDDGLSPTLLNLDAKENVITTNTEKKVSRHEKQVHYTSPKSKSGFKKHGKGQVPKVEDRQHDSAINVTRSF